MNNKAINALLASVVAVLLMDANGHGQSLSYSNAIAGLNPAGYWPMHEVEPAAPGDIETNYGSLGILGTGFYPDYQVNSGEFIRQQPGPLANGADQSICFNSAVPEGGTATNGMYVPRVSPLSALKPPFTVECWVMLTNNTPGQGDILSQCDGTKNSGFRFLLQNTPPADEFNTLTYKAGSFVQVNIASNTLGISNVWQYIVATCSAGTNIITYLDGAQQNSKSAAADFVVDTHTPFAVGTGLGFARSFHGFIAEVAVYTNALPGSDIATHYNDAINLNASATQYSNDVVNDPNGGAVIYLRMNSAPYLAPASGTWPALLNYGQTNGVAVSGGVYTPGTMPGIVAGTSYTNYPVGLASTNVAFLSGVSSFGDVGSAPIYNPTGGAPFTVTAVFRSNPADTNRAQSIVGHGTNSWELGLTAADTLVFNSGTNSTAVVATGTGAGDLVSTANYNDGRWHLVTATHNGTNNVLYVDGIANNTNWVTTNSIGNSLDMMIGSDPSYTNTPVGLGRQFAGQICEVAFFTSALTAAQVQTLYNNAGVLPAITQQPVSAIVNQNTAFTNTVGVTGGSMPLFYQWYTNGVAIGGATGSNLILSPVLVSQADTNYYVVVGNAFGSVTSAVVSLTVYASPIILSESPAPYTNQFALYAGVSPAFSVLGTGQQPIGYYWITNGVAVGGNTSTNFTMIDVQAAFTNYCVLSNVAGVVTSFVWSATILPTNTLPPYPRSVLALKPAAYWRMNDVSLDGSDNGNGDNGYICHDYVNGNDGIYTNVDLANAYGISSYTAADPTEVGADFAYVGSPNSDANSILAPDFSTPNGSNAEFTIEAWVYPNTQEAGNAGIVAKGLFNEEEFSLDCGAPTNSFRFEVRNAAGTVYNADSTLSTENPNLLNTWYHLVGVCDEANSNVSLYINGQLVASTAIPPLSGITNSSQTPVSIGARSSSPPPYTFGDDNVQFSGYIDDVAIFNYALSPNQILNQAFAPYFTQQPVAGTNADLNGVLIVPANAAGSAPLSYNWYDVNARAYMPGQTNATLVVSNISASDSYYLTVSNPFGSTNSTTVSVNIVSGAPQIDGQPQNPFYAVEGVTASNSVAAYGTAPVSFQWQFLNGTSWNNVLDNNRVSGAQNSQLLIGSVFPTDAGNYQVVVTNVYGAVTSSVAQLIVASLPLSFYSNGLDWTANGSANIANSDLSLTDPNNGGGIGSFFFQYPQYIGAFQAAFTYQAGGNMAADGISFCLQNDPRGVSALGGGGGSLGVGTASQITPSAELMMDIFGGSGYAFGFNGTDTPPSGATSPNFAAPGSVHFNSGDPINVTLYYANGRLALTFTDAVANTSFSTNLAVGSLPNVLGADTAYVGFTGAYGGSTSVQTITNFTFVSLASEAIQLNNPGDATVSWPGHILGYVLQQNSSVTSTNWVNVTNADNVINGQHQVVTPVNTTNLFYRLMLQQ